MPDESITLANRRIAFMTADEGVEEVELSEPRGAVARAGGRPTLIAPDVGKVQAFSHLERADTFEAAVVTSGAEHDEAVVVCDATARPRSCRAASPMTFRRSSTGRAPQAR